MTPLFLGTREKPARLALASGKGASTIAPFAFLIREKCADAVCLPSATRSPQRHNFLVAHLVHGAGELARDRVVLAASAVALAGAQGRRGGRGGGHPRGYPCLRPARG